MRSFSKCFVLIVLSVCSFLWLVLSQDTDSKVPVTFGYHDLSLPSASHNASGHPLRKRALTWPTALAAGQAMLDKLNGARSQSQFTTIAQLDVRSRLQ